MRYLRSFSVSGLSDWKNNETGSETGKSREETKLGENVLYSSLSFRAHKYLCLTGNEVRKNIHIIVLFEATEFMEEILGDEDLSVKFLKRQQEVDIEPVERLN